ncbi:MAG: 2-C-methyl-D-erythritol 4-phosphate cytidylyltransferase [Candidatus Hydrogenedentes bacterium]|nr:2-C-methyl-D-erythritol 4-phosphate cytidylyltransferase [Candidatus Hydrogenedentota bacterium]
MKTRLLVAAGGMGTRLGLGGPKALVEIAGKPMLVRTLERFAGLGLVDGAVIVVPGGYEPAFEQALTSAFPSSRFTLVPGGAERQISVSNGLEKLDAGAEIVVIHDAARPFVTETSIRASIESAEADGASTEAIPSNDTILQGDSNAYLVDTPDRQALWACQTPQTFQVDVIRRAHESARRDGYLGTDDASLVQRAGGRVKLVMGSPLNFKITTPTDLALAECVVREGLA